jgi:hypothetical protein
MTFSPGSCFGSDWLEASNDFVILGMCADPEPQKMVRFAISEGVVVDSDPHRGERVLAVQGLKV